MTAARHAPLTALIVLGGFMAGLDTSLVNVGLATIAGDLHAALPAVQGVTSGYLLALAAALPAGPWLQRRLGASRLWQFALIGFTASSLLCALAPSLPVLIAVRAAQGVFGGLLIPTGQKLVAEAVGLDRMGQVMAVAGLALVLAPVVGPALGGLLIDHLSWRWLFLVNLPIGGIAAIVAPRVLPANVPNAGAQLDVFGLALLAGGLAAFLLGLTRLGSPAAHGGSGPAVAVVGATLLVAFAVSTARRAAFPDRPTLLDLRLFRGRRYAAAQATVFFSGINLFGGLVLLPLYYETLRGASAGDAGVLLLAYGLGAMAAMPVAGRLTDRIGGGATCVAGLVTTVLATAPFVALPADANLVLVQVLQALRGVGIGLTGIPAMTAAFRAAPGNLADATTTANILQRVGGSLGSTLVAIIVARLTPQLVAFQLSHAVLVLTALMALGSALVFAVSERAQSSSSPQSVDPIHSPQAAPGNASR